MWNRAVLLLAPITTANKSRALDVEYHNEPPATTSNAYILVCVFIVVAAIAVVGGVGIYLSRPTLAEGSHDESRPGPEANRNPTHVIFIMADDLGFNDVSWNDPDVMTPNLEELARTGIILDRSYMQPSCTPSRAAFMTGRYPFHIGAQHTAIPAGSAACLDLNTKILPEYLKEQGYATHLVGKWHLGYCKLECTPTYRGFDTFYGYYNSHVDWYTHRLNGGFDWRDGVSVDNTSIGEYAGHLLTSRARNIIESHDPGVPLFLFMSFGAPHYPFLVPPGEEQAPQTYSGIRSNYLSLVTDMDESVGQLLDALKETGLYDSSVIIFTSDNGGLLGPASNFPLRGSKSSSFEGGTRVPSFVHSPLATVTGIVSNQTIHVSDWFPTIVSLAGSEEDLSFLDGVNQTDLILNGGSSQRHEFVYNIDQHDPTQSPGTGAIRIGDYKLIRGYPGWTDGYEQYNNTCLTFQVDLLTGVNPTECTVYQPPDFVVRGRNPLYPSTNYTDRVADNILLYNVMDDPSEEVNLAYVMPEKVTEMLARLEQLTSEAVDIDLSTLVRTPVGEFRNFGGVWSYGFC